MEILITLGDDGKLNIDVTDGLPKLTIIGLLEVAKDLVLRQKPPAEKETE